MSAEKRKGKDLLLVQRVRDEDDDEEQFKPLDWGLVRRLLTYASPVRRKLWVMVVLTVIRAAQLPALAWLSAEVITGPIAHGDAHGILVGTLLFAALAVVTDLMFHFRQRYALEIGETVVNGLRSDIFARTQRQPMSFFHRMKLGRILSRVTSDVEAVRVGVQDVGFVSAIQFGQMAFTAAVLAFRDWKMFLVVVGMAPILWAVNNHFRMKLSRLTRAAADSFSRVTATLAESVNGIRVTQGFVRQDTNAGLFRSLLSDHSRYNIALARTSAVLAPILELNSQFFVATLLIVGGWRIFHHSMAPTDLIIFILLSNFFFSPFTIIGNQYNQGLVAMASAERIFYLLDMKPDWEDDPAPRRCRTRGARPAAGARASSSAASPSATTRRGSSSTTSTSRPSRARRSRWSATRGAGRARSSTLSRSSTCRRAGEILVDGMEVRSITSRSLHRQMGMVQQQNFLFSGSVMENIRLSKPGATVHDVRDAAAKLGCLDFLDELSEGWRPRSASAARGSPWASASSCASSARSSPIPAS
jgi:ATP-binding cassette subfamily B protein